MFSGYILSIGENKDEAEKRELLRDKRLKIPKELTPSVSSGMTENVKIKSSKKLKKTIKENVQTSCSQETISHYKKQLLKNTRPILTIQAKPNVLPNLSVRVEKMSQKSIESYIQKNKNTENAAHEKMLRTSRTAKRSLDESSSAGPSVESTENKKLRKIEVPSFLKDLEESSDSDEESKNLLLSISSPQSSDSDEPSFPGSLRLDSEKKSDHGSSPQSLNKDKPSSHGSSGSGSNKKSHHSSSSQSSDDDGRSFHRSSDSDNDNKSEHSSSAQSSNSDEQSHRYPDPLDPLVDNRRPLAARYASPNRQSLERENNAGQLPRNSPPPPLDPLIDNRRPLAPRYASPNRQSLERENNAGQLPRNSPPPPLDPLIDNRRPLAPRYASPNRQSLERENNAGQLPRNSPPPPLDPMVDNRRPLAHRNVGPNRRSPERENNNRPFPARISPPPSPPVDNNRRIAGPNRRDLIQVDLNDSFYMIKAFCPKFYSVHEKQGYFLRDNRVRPEPPRYSITNDGEVYLGADITYDPTSWELTKSKRFKIFCREVAVIVWDDKVDNVAMKLNKAQIQIPGRSPRSLSRPRLLELFLSE
uniref:Uncharacterized protein n=1 Tax=Trichogramma kaykai TaxID=54128 RepID=A0ABD2WR10_9HYME